MFIFAHIFAGALLGLVFWHLTNDRRAIPVCIAGSLLSDLIDKSLGLLFPSVLSSGRTVFHSLGFVVVILLFTFLFIRSNLRFLGVGFACAVLFHQVFDEMWTLPANWFYPLLGPFQGSMIPDYILTYFWLEITSPAEWIFMAGTLVILVKSYNFMPECGLFHLSDRMKSVVYTCVVAVIGCTGLYLVVMGLAGPLSTFLVPVDTQVNDLLTGVLALTGAVIMSREKYETPIQTSPLFPQIQTK
jgi:LexA-binding, inner membrane-associated putative hydrolase